jgi:hypothetical protein
MTNGEKLREYFEKTTAGYPLYDSYTDRSNNRVPMREPPEFEWISEISGDPDNKPKDRCRVIKKYRHIESGEIYEAILIRKIYCNREVESIKRLKEEEI